MAIIMGLSIELSEAIHVALERGRKTPSEVAQALWPSRTDSERATVDAHRCLERLVADGGAVVQRFPDGDIYIPTLAPIPGTCEHTEHLFRFGKAPNQSHSRRPFDAEAICRGIKDRFSVADAVIVLPEGANGLTVLHYIGGHSDRDNEYVGELEGIETAVERFMDEWVWPSSETTHQWHDPRLPLCGPFLDMRRGSTF